MTRRQSGHATLEYIVVGAMLAFALFVPIGGDAASPDSARSTVQIVLECFHRAYQNISYALSLPS
ncbi:hypothetical protein ACFOLJ_01845 [Rugamonas sp. CCM 8940]|uniref:hypothetical protein n=1 Tax=Rugamonas sp. CCM 8940 TaxID=2765359 RepID=UPI0018F2A9AD|nr:hypothetical protein [Rugamonas sp. CCM 8940]MBJ7311685.1 hypothetical protein [Rugamonas sp. CCM 8940]